MGESQYTSKEIAQAYLKKADDFNTQILTSIGSYIRFITADDAPDAKQVKKLISLIEKPISELSKLSLECKLSEEVVAHIRDLESYKTDIHNSIKNNKVSSETTDRVVNLYHKTSDIDNLLFDLITSDEQV
jgi:hypothetical protein